MDIVIASNNAHKIVEIKALVGSFFDNVFSLKDKNIDIEIEETGSTFYENALIKAKTISDITGLAALADDSGIAVDALGGAPGVYSARFSGEGATDEKNNRLLLARLEGAAERNARFVSAVVLYYPDGSIVAAEGVCEGEILLKADGTGGFGYDPLFYSYDLKKSFGAATAAEKNSCSHRAKALLELQKKLSENRF